MCGGPAYRSPGRRRQLAAFRSLVGGDSSTSSTVSGSRKRACGFSAAFARQVTDTWAKINDTTSCLACHDRKNFGFHGSSARRDVKL